MTEPPRPPAGENPDDPTRPTNQHWGGDPAAEPGPPPAYDSPPPTFGAAAPPPGYGAQPPGYGAPPPGYGGPPAGYGAPPPGYASNEDKTWALVAHFGGIVVGFIAPLIVLLARGSQSPTVRAHAVEALNFQITWGIAAVVASILAVCTAGILFFLPMITWIVVIVFSILAGIKANDGEVYHYPMTWRPVR